jgi:protein involved in polysaccharide export with SLBB domain
MAPIQIQAVLDCQRGEAYDDYGGHFMRILALFSLVLFGIPAPSQPNDSYRLATGDTIHVVVRNEPDFTFQTELDPNGFVQVPVLGKVLAAESTAEQLAVTIERRLSEIIGRPRVVVEVVHRHPR